MKTEEEIEKLANDWLTKTPIKEWGGAENGFLQGYTQCQEDMVDKDKWTFDEILNACYPTLGRGSDWCDIVKRLREQKLNKQD
jgi:hypothetical protein